jgi:nucleoside-diphosphate-sugar epimerase
VQRLIELSGTGATVAEEKDRAGSSTDAGPWQQADTRLIEKTLGWTCRIPLDESLADTWAGREQELAASQQAHA